MSERSRQPLEPELKPGAAERPPPALTGDAARLLALQRGAGNQAVSRLVATERALAEHERAHLARSAMPDLLAPPGRLPVRERAGKLLPRLRSGLALSRCSTDAPARTRPGPTTAPAHLTGQEVDDALDASAFFHDFVQGARGRGVQAAGHVHIEAPDDFVAAYVRYAITRTNSATGARFTEDEARARAARVNAFRDGDEIYIHRDRGEAGTTIHESMHLFADAGWLGRVKRNVNEGTAELFTKKLCAERGVTRGNFYSQQHASVRKLADAVGENTLAAAYFQGAIGALETAVDARGAGTFGTWLGHMIAGRYAEADATW